MNKMLLEMVKIVKGAGPVLLNSGAITGDYVSMKNYGRVCVLISVAPASGTDTSVITLKQAKTVDNSPVTEKALDFTKYYRQLPDTSDAFVETTASSSITTSATAQREVFAIEVKQTDLDIANEFDCFRVNMTDPGSVSTPCDVTMLCYDPVTEATPADMRTALTD